MNVFLRVDIEGVCGLVRWPEVSSTGIDDPRARRFLPANFDDAIVGASAGCAHR